MLKLIARMSKLLQHTLSIYLSFSNYFDDPKSYLKLFLVLYLIKLLTLAKSFFPCINQLFYEWRIHDINTKENTHTNYYLSAFHKYNCFSSLHIYITVVVIHSNVIRKKEYFVTVSHLKKWKISPRKKKTFVLR